MSRQKADDWREYFMEQDELHYNTCMSYLSNLNDESLIKVIENILNDEWKEIPLLHRGHSYLSVDDCERWRKCAHSILKKKGYNLEVIT